MKQPSALDYTIIIGTSLIFTVAGLYFITCFNRLFKSSIRNEFLRRNISAFIVIFCISVGMIPLSGSFFYLLDKYGWAWTIAGQFISTAACTLFIYSPARFVIENKNLKKLSFLNHALIILAVIVILTLAVNLLLSYWLYGHDWKIARKYIITSSIYIGAAIGLIFVFIKYLNIERQRKFDQKELELSRLRELKTKAELEALHSKINPHFLYNALNSIADLSITDGKKGRKMTIALADLFRYSINYSDNNYSTVKDELSMTEVYLQIEKIRFEDQLNYSISAEEDIKHYLIPRFLLQPLVENAVKHGLKATGKMTEIKIETKKDGEGLLINVADNGPAFPDELTPGYGLKSIYDKLDLLFPGSYEVYFSNEPFKRVSIHISKLMKSEHSV